MNNYYVIGLSNNPNFILSDEVHLLLQQHLVFSGGKRHYELVKALLPINHVWIDIAGDMPSLFKKYETHKQSIIVFASGDPLFYGFGNTIKKYHPNAKVKIYAHFNSLQKLCHRNGISYQNMVNTSVHGRTWEELDIALIKQSDLIGVLTDAVNTPTAIAKRMLDYNFTNYKMIVGEALDGADEKISQIDLQECTSEIFDPLNCVLLIKKQSRQKLFGIPDAAFSGLENRPNMITKMPLRLLSLSQLSLYNKKTLWDIGFCTASLSIEAKTQFPHLNVVAFEKREECSVIFDANTCLHSTPGITKVMGDFFDANLNDLPAPDAVFIGGHGNKLEALLALVDQYLITGGTIAMNAVKNESRDLFIKGMEQLNYKLFPPIAMRIDEHNPITVLTAEKKQK